MFPLVSGVAMGQGPPALAISITNNGIRDFVTEGPIGEAFPATTANGAIDLTAAATGGDGSYSYAWAVTEQGDTNNIATGNVQLSTTGTQNAATYNTSKITVTDTGLSAGDPPIEASYFYACTVTDGTGTTASAQERITVIIVGLE